MARLAEMAEMDDTPDYPRLASEVLGIRGARGELARRLVEQALVVEDRREIWRRTGDAICRRAPTSPGVYTLFDQSGCVLYVGKATNLPPTAPRPFCQSELAGHEAWYVSREQANRRKWLRAGSAPPRGIGDLQLRPRLNTQVGPPRAQKMRHYPAIARPGCLLILPSIEPDSAELIAARADGPVLTQRTGRHDRKLPHTRVGCGSSSTERSRFPRRP